MKAKDIAKALTFLSYAKPFDFKRNLVVENVYWGFGLSYEADLIAVSRSGYCTEIEIKVSKADLLNDLKKDKHRKPRDKRIARYFFAVPEELAEIAIKSLPEDIGVISIKLKPGHTRYTCTIMRPAKRNKNANILGKEDLDKLYHLQNFRYWSRM